MSPQRFRALLIGNWDYTDPSGELLPLKGPRNDVRRLHDALTDLELGLFDPRDVVVRENLESKRIGQELTMFLDGARHEDRLLIYFSGHGERLLDQQLGLCGIDVNRRFKDTECFDTTWLRKLLEERSRSDSTIVVLDCCYAGQMKGPVLTEETLATSFGTGTFVLSSGGNEPSSDASDDGAPSPFTAALVEVLLDRTLQADRSGHVSVDDIFRALDQHVPPLLPKPRRNAQGRGALPIARRPVVGQAGAPARPELKRFRPDQEFEVVELRFERDTVVALAEGGDEERLSLDGLDPNRLAAVCRLGELCDAVMRTQEYTEDAEWRSVVRRAWDCVGANLLETAVPPRLRQRLLGGLVVPSGRVLDLRLRFEGGNLMDCPWEYLYAQPSGPGADDARLPLALSEGVVVERIAGDEAGGPAPARSTSPTVAIVNCLRGGYARAGELAAEHLGGLAGLNVVADLPGARWGDFLDAVDQRPHHLLLFVPVAGQREGPSDLGFAGAAPEVPEWRPVTEVAGELRKAGLSFECLVVVSFAARPGRNSVRGTFDVARRLAAAHVGPVAFVCHAQGYEAHLGRDGQPTFPALLVDVLTRPDPPTLTHALHYARSQVVQLASQEARSLFGVPGLYRPPEPAGGLGPVRRGMAVAGAPAAPGAAGRPATLREGLPR